MKKYDFLLKFVDGSEYCTVDGFVIGEAVTECIDRLFDFYGLKDEDVIHCELSLSIDCPYIVEESCEYKSC